jgi:hypothetical protein
VPFVDVTEARTDPLLDEDHGYFGFSSTFFSAAATSAHNWVNSFCSSAGSLASAALSRMPVSVAISAQ